MKVEFFLSSSAFRQAPGEVAAYARAHNYGGVEWYLDLLRLPVAPSARAKLFDRMRADGLGARFHAPAADMEMGHRDPAIAEVSLRYLLMYIEFLAEIAPTILTVHVGSRAIPMELLAWERTLDHLRQAAEAGRTRGVTVCLENLKGGWTSDPNRLLAMAEAAGCAITFDLGHASASPFVREGGTLEAFRAVVGPRIANVHVYEIETPDGRHLPLEDTAGHGPTLDALLAGGLHTWILELSTREDLEQTRQALRAYEPG
ncbi:MAG: sugar phosphate isomerase/epimerase family protein [bacterium]|nr:sugar phosphate isomerase/epimerase family protein [bacterium]